MGNENLPTTRDEAKAHDEKFYYTNTPCRNGHVAERYASSGRCSICIAEKNRRDHANKRKYQRQWRTKNREYQRRWRAKNPEYYRQYYAKNPERIAEHQRKWRQANPHLVNAQRAKRRAAKLQATPAWADHEAIDAKYEIAKKAEELLGEPHQVDHWIPLQGELVCGLHVAENLRVIPAEDNLRKGNTHFPTDVAAPKIKEVQSYHRVRQETYSSRLRPTR